MQHLTLSLSQLSAHRIDAQLTLTVDAAQTLTLQMARWIPGSYLLRDFAKHLTIDCVTDNQGKALTLKRLDLASWQLDAPAGQVEIRYHLYAFDASVRANYVCAAYAFINPTATALLVKEWRARPYQLSITAPINQTNWQVHTTLPSVTLDNHGFGDYLAQDYDELIEHPLLIGDAVVVDFQVCGLPHQMVLVDEAPLHQIDRQRLADDLTRICTFEQRFWQTEQHELPIQRYLFQVMVTHNGYGGLEHTDSTALMIPRQNLPYMQQQTGKAYDDFLALCSHEYFHLWLVKRIKPQGMHRPELTDALITPMLWVFEGFTSLYDDWILHRSGVINLAQLLKRWSNSLTRTLTTHGGKEQALATASEEAWIKFYQPNEHSANSQISYYTRGMAVALLLQAKLWQHGVHVDELLHRWWQQWQEAETCLLDHEQVIADLQALCPQVDWAAWLATHVLNVDAQLTEYLEQQIAYLGLTLSSKQQPSLGLSCAEENGQLIIKRIDIPGAAVDAGLQVGDELISLNQWRVSNSKDIEQQLNRWHCAQNNAMEVTYARQGYVQQTQLQPSLTTHQYELVVMNDSNLGWLTSTIDNKSHTHA